MRTRTGIVTALGALLLVLVGAGATLTNVTLTGNRATTGWWWTAAATGH
jgi:hypothetical protein